MVVIAKKINITSTKVTTVGKKWKLNSSSNGSQGVNTINISPRALRYERRMKLRKELEEKIKVDLRSMATQTSPDRLSQTDLKITVQKSGLNISSAHQEISCTNLPVFAEINGSEDKLLPVNVQPLPVETTVVKSHPLTSRISSTIPSRYFPKFLTIPRNPLDSKKIYKTPNYMRATLSSINRSSSTPKNIFSSRVSTKRTRNTFSTYFKAPPRSLNISEVLNETFTIITANSSALY